MWRRSLSKDRNTPELPGGAESADRFTGDEAYVNRVRVHLRPYMKPSAIPNKRKDTITVNATIA